MKGAIKRWVAKKQALVSQQCGAGYVTWAEVSATSWMNMNIYNFENQIIAQITRVQAMLQYGKPLFFRGQVYNY